MTLSLVIVVKNGAQGIAKTIQSVDGIANEIVVVDNGSTDDTVAIAKKYTKNVYTESSAGDFSKLRNFALSKATSDWILVLDADETLMAELRDAIPNLMQNPDYDGYWFRRRWYVDEKRYLHYGLFYPDYQMRLFRNSPENRYIHKVHEENTVPETRTQEVKMDICHFHSIDKYLSAEGFGKLAPYINLLVAEQKDRHVPSIRLLWESITTFFSMFVMGLTRGKGILDGWTGVKAHYFFTLSIMKGYWGAL